MKFPSLSQLWLSFLTVCKRFSLAILYALLATIAALALSYDNKDFEAEQTLVKFIYLGNFGLVLSLAFSLYIETNLTNNAKKLGANILILAILALIYFTLQPAIYQADVFLLLAIGFAFHLLVAFSAFLSKGQEIGFWQLNKTFFLRFATAALYSTALFAGLSIALLSIHTLFNVTWDNEIYIRLWIIIVGLFNTVFFLAGIPQPLVQLNKDHSYPKALKLFTQYVLIPLASIYLLILLAYEVKIILEWSLPTSSVAILILGYAVFGILSILLVHPIRNSEGNKWIKLYSKSFYLLMLPLLVLLAVAVVKRISDYGITESRYLLIVLSLWLTFITIYFLIKGREHIRIIPISLFVLSILIVIGPWSIKSLSLRSQSNRLANYIQQKPSPKRDDEIRSLVSHLTNDYGSESLQPFVKIDLKAIELQERNKPLGREVVRWGLQREIADTVLASLKVSSTSFAQLWDEQQKNYVNAAKGVVSVEGALQLIAINSNYNNEWDKQTNFSLTGKNFSVRIEANSNVVVSDSNGGEIVFNSSQILKPLYKNKALKADKDRSNSFAVSNDIMTIERRFHNHTFKLRLEELSAFYQQQNPAEPTNVCYSGYLIVYPNL